MKASLRNDRRVAGTKGEWKVFLSEPFQFGSQPCLHPHPNTHPSTPPPARASSPLRKQLLKGTKRPLSVSLPSCASAKCQAVYIPREQFPGVSTGRACGGRPVQVPWQQQQAWAVLTAQEAGFVEAVALALDLLSKVDCLLAHPAFLASSPVWHSGKKNKTTT